MITKQLILFLFSKIHDYLEWNVWKYVFPFLRQSVFKTFLKFFLSHTRAADRERHTTRQGDWGTKQRRKEEAWPPGQRLQEEQNSLISKTMQQQQKF
jgi:hypothetical protein